MTWLHTYSGLLLGWLMFVIWVTGTLSYFNPEISLWMKPELGYSQNRASIVDRSLDLLHEKGVQAERWRIDLPDSRSNLWSIEWRNGSISETMVLSPENTQIVAPRDTAGGDFFKTFHYTLQLRGYGGRYFAGLAAFTFLVAIFSGIFTHRRFFKDFFTLRTGKVKVFLRDFHALAGVITIPFNLMICVSALMIYVLMFMPWSAEHYFDGGARAVFGEVNPKLPRLNDDAPAAKPVRDFDKVQNQISRLWPGENQVARIMVEQPYKENGRFILYRVKDESLSQQAERLVFSSVTGEMLNGFPEQSLATQVRRVFWGLHEAKFAAPILRWLFFFLGVVSSGMIAAGLIYWLRVRLTKTESRRLVHYLVERLNIVAIIGLILAIAGFFLANRLLPIGIAGRESIEIQVFFWVWLTSFIHAFFRSPTQAWQEQLILTGFVYLSVVITDLVQDNQRMIDAFQQSNLPYLGFAAAMLVSSMLLFAVAIKLNKIKREESYETLSNEAQRNSL